MGRMSIGYGAGAGLTDRKLNDKSGTETISLSSSNIPPHSHTISDPGHSHSIDYVSGLLRFPSSGIVYDILYYNGSNKNTTTNQTGITSTNSYGSATPFNVMNPFLVLNYIIKS